MANASTLQLVRESKIRDLLPPDSASGAWEASGVLAKEGTYFVVFDNHTSVARLSANLLPSETNDLFGVAPAEEGYEGITYNAAKNRYYLLVESRKHKSGHYRAEIIEYNDSLSYIKNRPVDFAFKSRNKGFEAIVHLRRENQDYLLALCEGNKCVGGRKGRIPGGGRIQLFERKKKRWSHIDTIKLPMSVLFVDYSAMSIDGDRVAIVSQENSLLWIGEFEKSTWSWHDEGHTYEFPRTDNGDVRYGNVEGVAWIAKTRIVTVSDKRKKGEQPKHFKEKDQSIHIFDLPG